MISSQRKEYLWKILLKPHLTEKTSMEGGQYAFKVLPNAVKPDIKAAVELVYNVVVKTVQVCHVKGKKKGSGKTMGKQKGWKKAYIKLAEGHTIDMIATQA